MYFDHLYYSIIEPYSIEALPVTDDVFVEY